jgi:hypothetical protein
VVAGHSFEDTLMTIRTNRRSVLAAIPAIAATSVVVIPAFAATGADARIIAAWEQRKAAYLDYNNSPMWEGDGPDPQEVRFWAIVDEAEELIRSSVATTARGAEIQLWVALYHSESHKRDRDTAIITADLSAVIEHDAEMDWHTRFILGAIRSLRAGAA